MVKLFHYTTYDRLQGIKRERTIESSSVSNSATSPRDMFYGAGVYLTTLDPHSHSKEEIGLNNWSNGGERRIEDGFCDYYVEIDIPEEDHRLEKIKGRQDNWLYRGDLRLDHYEWDSGKNSEWSALGVAAGVGLGLVAVGGLLAGGLALYESYNKEREQKEREQEDKKKRKY